MNRRAKLGPYSPAPASLLARMLKLVKEGPVRLPAQAAGLLRFAEMEQRILWMAGLPLLDGVFASAVLGESLASPVKVIVFGFTVFSGPGCMTFAALLSGSLRQRLTSVARVYGLVFTGAAATVALAPMLMVLLVPDFVLFSAVVLWGLGATLLSATVARVVAARLGSAAMLPPVVLAVGLAVSAAYTVATFPPRFEVALLAPGQALCAVLPVPAGMALTMLAAALAGAMHGRLDRPWLVRGGGGSLLLIGFQVLGVPLPDLVPLALFVACFLIGMRAALTPTMTAVTRRIAGMFATVSHRR